MTAPDWPDDLIVRSLIEFGEWSYIEQALAAQLVCQGDVIWDGGAFLGSFGIGLAQIATAASRAPSRLLAIEPGPKLRSHVMSNLERAMPAASGLVSFAIGPATGKLAVRDNLSSIMNHGAVAYDIRPHGDIESRALWQIREEYGDYDFLKLDLEGMELIAITSDFSYLKERQPVIWAECNESWDSVLVLEAMVSLGYEPVYLAFPAFRIDNFRANCNIPFGMAYEAVLLAASPERLALLDIHTVSENVIRRDVRTSFDLRQALWSTPRWAETSWLSLSQPELIALLGRATLGQKLENFLTHAPH